MKKIEVRCCEKVHAEVLAVCLQECSRPYLPRETDVNIDTTRWRKCVDIHPVHRQEMDNLTT